LLHGLRSLLLLILEHLEFLSSLPSLFLLDQEELCLSLFLLHSLDLSLGRVEFHRCKIRIDLCVSIIFTDDLIKLSNIVSDARVKEPRDSQHLYLVLVEAALLFLDLELVLLHKPILHWILE
jgi:hypothetical protein